MEAKEIMDIIVGILASLGLIACLVAALYCTYSMVVIDEQLKQKIKEYDSALKELEKE